jgi:glycine cleavage system H protein
MGWWQQLVMADLSTTVRAVAHKRGQQEEKARLGEHQGREVTLYPKEMKFTRYHEYIRLKGDGTGFVGLTHYAQEAVGDVVFVGMPIVGKFFKACEAVETIESVITATDYYMPTDAEVIEINGDLEAHPEYVNEDPYVKGWFAKVKVQGELSPGLLGSDAYQVAVTTQSRRGDSNEKRDGAVATINNGGSVDH